MQTSNFTLTKLEADTGKVFDYVNLEEHTHEEENPETGEKEIVVDHLYAKTIFLGVGDSADNYIEVTDPNLEIGGN